MAYTVTCYCKDEKINTTTSSYETNTGYNTKSGQYGSSSLGSAQEFTHEIPSDKDVTFTAHPLVVYDFYRWAYRVGSTTSLLRYDYNQTFVYTGRQDIFIRAEGQKFVKWDWTSTTDRVKAYNAITSKGKTTDFKHTVWNELVDRVYKLRRATLKQWSSSYATYENTKCQDEPYTLTADMFNSLCYNLMLVYGSNLPTVYDIPYPVSPGDDVRGYYFEGITDALNSAIETEVY